ncbi:MAG: PQQ-binding-like beta-propeller repeat protein [Myxococcales bacterium]|nr:PQQ-binding-like beta-propeller repeat protein [Myxococcales bacterium]
MGARGAIAGLVLTLLSLAAGCGAGIKAAFDTRFPDNAPKKTRVALARLAEAEGRAGVEAGVIPMTTAGVKPELLLVEGQSGQVRWRRALLADSRPQLLGDLVVVSAGGRLEAFDAESGLTRFGHDLTHPIWLGAARAGDVVVGVGTTRTGSAAETRSQIIALDARDGRLLWSHQADGAMGRPAAQAGLVAVPWQRQSVVLLDPQSGRELARLRSRDDGIEWVQLRDGKLLFGDGRIYVVGAGDTYRGLRSGPVTPLSRPALELPGAPRGEHSAYQPRPGAPSAHGRVDHVVGLEQATAGVASAHGRQYGLFYRHVFGFDAAGKLLWARALQHDAVAARSLGAGLLVVTATGEVLLLAAADGRIQPRFALATSIASANLEHAGELSPDGVPTAATAPSPELQVMLRTLALDTDARTVPARRFSVRMLSALPEPSATRDLLQIYEHPSSPPELDDAVAAAVRERTAGSIHLVEALDRRYDFIQDTRPPPLPMLVPALLNAQERRAVPLLIERMNDHETPLSNLPAVVRAVRELGDASVVEPLMALLRSYRADSALAQVPEVFDEAARGVLQHGGESGPELLRSLLDDGRASRALGDTVARLLAPADRSPVQRADAPPPPPPAPLPATLAGDAIARVFDEHAAQLKPCIDGLLARSPKLAQIRLAFIAEGDGSIHALSFLPDDPELVACMVPQISAYRFPRFREARTVARHVIRIGPETRRVQNVARSAPATPTGPWWQAHVSAGFDREGGFSARPWWQLQSPLGPVIDPVATPAPAIERFPDGAPAEPAAVPPEPQPTAPAGDAWWQPVEDAATNSAQ